MIPAPLEEGVRIKFRLNSEDPIAAVVGACGRLLEAGVSPDYAVDTVLRILREESDRVRDLVPSRESLGVNSQVQRPSEW